jgi:uncharacterized protein (TIGR03437 family)
MTTKRVKRTSLLLLFVTLFLGLQFSFVCFASAAVTEDSPPQITGINPSSGNMGSEVILTGTSFGQYQESSRVSFGDKQALLAYWMDTQIKCAVPYGLTPGPVPVTVTNSAGTSNQVVFNVNTPAPISIASISPDSEGQFGLLKGFTVKGSGFQQYAIVSFDNGSTIIRSITSEALSETEITCTMFFFGQEPGSYDVVVMNPDGGEARLPDAFVLNSLCGTGSGSAILMLGLTMGLFSLASSGGIIARRRRRKAS